MTIESNRLAGARADFRRDDFIIPRTRSDAAWRDLERTPPMESTLEKAVGIALFGTSGFAVLIVIVDLVRIFT